MAGMETRQVLLVDAFAADPAAGTPVGVVPDAAGLTDDQGRAIASELGAGETALVDGVDAESVALRRFADGRAIDRSAPATVAALAAGFDRGTVDAGTRTVETDGDAREVAVYDDGTVWIDEGEAQVRQPDVDHEELATALGVDVATLRDVGADLPPGRASVGPAWLLVPVNYFEHLSDASPDATAIADLCERTDADGLYAFTFDTIDGNATVHGRTFAAPRGADDDVDGARDRSTTGAVERPTTGTAEGVCGAYLRIHAALDGERDEIVFEGGHFLDRPGRVRVRSDGATVEVGGRAVTTLDGEMVVPDPAEDDIIEV